MPDLELDSVLRCPTCRGVPFRVYRRRVAPESPVWESVLWPATPDVFPPESAARALCPDCRVPCQRGAP
jgi:hypothetical protein